MPNNRLVGDKKSLKNEIGGNGEIHQEEKRMVETKESDCTDSSSVIDLLGFPQNVIQELSDHFVFLDYMHFRAVCRRFSVAAPAIRWRESPKIEPAEACLLSPFLMFIGEDPEIYNLIDLKFSETYFIRIPNELKDARILHSKGGWLLMSKDQASMFLFNPFTRSVLCCPDNPPGSSYFVFGVSSIPTLSECLVVGITTLIQGVLVRILSYNHDEAWTSLEFEFELDFEPNSNSPVFWNGAFYFLGQEGNLRVLKREEAGSYSWNVLDKPQPPCESFNQNFLVECEERLLSVFVGDFGEWVRVSRLDQSDLVWNEVHTLGNRTMYLSRSSSFSTVAMYKEMENRIYFPRLHTGSLVFYSLETQKLHYRNCLEDSLADYCGSSEQLLCGWIEPRWS